MVVFPVTLCSSWKSSFSVYFSVYTGCKFKALFPGVTATMSDKSSIVLTLTEDDIPGASRKEPLEKHNVAALKWWLLCSGIQVSSSCKKMNVIER